MMDHVRNTYFKNISKDSTNLNGYDNTEMKMFRLHQYSFFNIKPNEIMRRKFIQEKINMMKSIFVIFLLVAFLTGLYYFLTIIISDIYTTYRLYILKVWLLPSLIQLFIVRFCIMYSLNFFVTCLLYKYYAMRKVNWKIKLLYFLLNSKEVKCMYKIRNFITKYFKKLNQLKEEQNESEFLESNRKTELDEVFVTGKY